MERLIPQPSRPPEGWLTEVQFLQLCEERGRAGDFDSEPDFPKALAEYRAALQKAKACDDPPFDPPEDFMPDLAGTPHLLLYNWRTAFRFPEVIALWFWLAEITERVDGGIPALTEAEFAELAAWFDQNKPRLWGCRSRRRCSTSEAGARGPGSICAATPARGQGCRQAGKTPALP